MKKCIPITGRSRPAPISVMERDEAIVIEEKLFGDCFESYDQKEGMAAFLEKRKVEKFLNK